MPTIKELRMQKGMTAADLAKAVGTSRSHLSEIERGKKNPSMELAKKISAVIGSEWMSPDNKSEKQIDRESIHRLVDLLIDALERLEDGESIKS